jgi:hypothetical protein
MMPMGPSWQLSVHGRAKHSVPESVHVEAERIELKILCLIWKKLVTSDVCSTILSFLASCLGFVQNFIMQPNRS